MRKLIIISFIILFCSGLFTYPQYEKKRPDYYWWSPYDYHSQYLQTPSSPIYRYHWDPLTSRYFCDYGRSYYLESARRLGVIVVPSYRDPYLDYGYYQLGYWLGVGAISLISKAMSSKDQDNYLKSEYEVGYNFSPTDLRSRYNNPKPYPEYKNIADIIAIIHSNDTNQYVPFDKIYNLALFKSKGEITDVQIEIILSIDRAILQERDMRERMKLKVKRERLMRGFKTPLWKEFYKRLEKKYPKQKN